MSASATKEILPVQFIMPIEQKSLPTALAAKCYGTSRNTLWRLAGKHGITKNIFGNYNVEDLEKLRLMKPSTKTKKRSKKS